MDKFIKYPLDIDKSLVDWDSPIMKYGGKQLIEILEKEISLNELIENKEKYDLDSNDKLKRLKVWLKYNCDADKAKKELGYGKTSTVVSFFYRNVSALTKLYSVIDITPYVDEGEIESRFSFIKYNVVKHENGFIIAESYTDEDYWDKNKTHVNKEVFKSMNKIFIYKRDNNGNLIKIDKESKEGRDLIDMKNITDSLN